MLAIGVAGADLAVIVVIVVLLVLLAFLALAETSLTRMNRARAAGHVEAGETGGARLLELAEEPARFLNGLLLVVQILQTAQIALTTILALRLFGSVGVLVVLALDVAVLFVLTEAAPKTWALQHLDAAALRSARPVRALTRFWPVRLLARGLIGVTNVILPGKGLQQGPFVSEEELLAMAVQAAEDDVIEATEQNFIARVIDFGDTIVREVMVPRTDMVTVAATFRVADAMEVVLLNGYSRIPVCGDGIDDVVGVLYAKDLMRAERDGAEESRVAPLARSARYVPETKRVAELLREMQDQKFHLAIVIDEYGGTAGLVTLEDLIEELVGEIVDEYDVEEPMVEPLPGGALRVNARLSIDEANEVLDAALPEGDWDSVGGLLFSLLGHVAIEGEAVRVGRVELRADKVQGRRISKVRITRVDDPDGSEPSDENASGRSTSNQTGGATGATNDGERA